MREHGPVVSAGQLGLGGHVCWGFDDEDRFAEAALEFLADGQRMGQRLAHVSAEPVEVQRDTLASVGGFDALIDIGALQLFALSDFFDMDRPVDADRQIALFSRATDQALSDGYTGLRVAANATELVVNEDKHEAHLRWEAIADRYMASNPLSAMCAYDCRALPTELLGDLAALHPACHSPGPLPHFRLYSDSDGVVLDGEVDVFCAEDFDRLLDIALQEEPTALDLGRLEFIDHRGLDVLVSHLRRRAEAGSDVEVRHVPIVVRRLCDVLELEHVG